MCSMAMEQQFLVNSEYANIMHNSDWTTNEWLKNYTFDPNI